MIEAPIYPQHSDKGDKRMCFATEKTNATKLIMTLDVGRAGAKDMKEVRSQQFADYMRLSFEDGTVLFVNTSDAETITTAEGYEFAGAAFMYNADSMMLMRGTNVKLYGKDLISSDEVTSVSLGKNEICISSVDKDANVKLYAEEKCEKIIKHADMELYEIPEGKRKHGLTWNNNDDCVEVSVYPGVYTLYNEKKMLPGKKETGELDLIIDGESHKVRYDGVYDISDNLTGSTYMEGYEGLYVFEDASDGVVFGDTEPGALIELNGKVSAYVKGKEKWIRLTSTAANQCEIDVNEDAKAFESGVDAKVRAVDFSYGGNGTKVVWWERIQDNTLQNFSAVGQTAGWEIDVPEDGKYDIIMSVSTVDGVTSDKIFRLGDMVGRFNIPATVVYSKLEGLRVKCGVDLKAGANRLDLINIDNYSCIFDWIGMIKSDK